MKSLWARYIEEMFDGRVTFIEYEWGFIAYSFPPEYPDAVFVEDVYIVPEQRNASHALRLHAEVIRAGRKAGKKRSLFIVRLDSAACAENLRIYLAMGFVPCATGNGTIFLTRKFKGEGNG